MFKYVYFFLHGIITKTSIEFIKRNSFIREKLIIVVNIKEVRPHNECRLIEQKLKRAIREQLGPLAVDLLYMGDINEEFNLRSEELRSGLSDWELIKEWEKRQIDFNELKEKYRNSIIGDYLIDDIIDTGSGQFSDIEGYHNGIDKILFDIDESVNIEKDKLLSLAEDGHPNAQFLLAEMIKEGRNDFKQDEEEAKYWYRKAFENSIMNAEKVDIRSQFILGRCMKITMNMKRLLNGIQRQQRKEIQMHCII